jgi:hypothetical protein
MKHNIHEHILVEIIENQVIDKHHILLDLIGKILTCDVLKAS